MLILDQQEKDPEENNNDNDETNPNQDTSITEDQESSKGDRGTPSSENKTDSNGGSGDGKDNGSGNNGNGDGKGAGGDEIGIPDVPEKKELESISAAWLGSDNVELGSSFQSNKGAIHVTAHYSNGDEELVDGWTSTGFNSLTLNEGESISSISLSCFKIKSE